MNVITIMSDEHSFEAMRWAGNETVSTPNLDRLADMSVKFMNAYTPCPLCVPARASCYTGQFVNRLGTWDNATPYDGTVPGIASYLKQKGIPTWHFGKTHFHPDGEYGFSGIEMPGFLNHPDMGCYYRDRKIGRPNAEKRFEEIGLRNSVSHDDEVTRLAMKWLRENKDRKEPWNLEIGYLDPHFPFYVKQNNWEYFDCRIRDIPEGTRAPFTSLNEPLSWLRTYFKGETATEEIIRKILVGYSAAVKELDERIGQLLDLLEEMDLLKNTAIIYTSDHGEQLGYHGLWWKCCMFEQSVHIPMLLYHPDIGPGTVCEPVSLVDVFPTICDILQIPQPEEIDGKSLWKLMKNGVDEEWREYVFSEYHAHGMPCAMYMIRWKQYKYVYYTEYPPQLFDLNEDPEENDDLWKYLSDRADIQKIEKTCRKFLYEICDPNKTDRRAREYQKRMRDGMGISEKSVPERGSWVPHPEYSKGG